MEIKYYVVKAKCGHVGRNNYILVDFGVAAQCKKEAAQIARHLPRVKHHHKDAIVEIKEVEYDTYKSRRAENSKLGYLKSKNIQDQRLYYPDYYNERITESQEIKNYKKANIPFRIVRQLSADKEHNSRDYNEMKKAYLWKMKKTLQN